MPVFHLHSLPLGGADEALGEHGYEAHDVAVLPVGLAHGRLDSRYVEQLVYERQELFSLPRYYLARMAERLRLYLPLLHLCGITEDDCKRSSEFVGDVGEE